MKIEELIREAGKLLTTAGLLSAHADYGYSQIGALLSDSASIVLSGLKEIEKQNLQGKGVNQDVSA